MRGHTHAVKVGYSTWRETIYDLNSYFEYITIYYYTNNFVYIQTYKSRAGDEGSRLGLHLVMQ